MPVSLGRVRLPHADFSATSLRTPCMRDASKSASPGLEEDDALATRGALRRSRRNWTGSLPAAWASSSRSEEHTSELQSLTNLVCRLLLEKKKKKEKQSIIIE